MRGDNFKPVSAETASWVLQQHFALQDVPIDVCGPAVTHRHQWIKPKPERPIKLTKPAKRILLEVCEKHGLPWQVVAYWFGKVKANRARQEFWARCRAEITIENKPASFVWIGRQTGHDSSSVMRGIKAHRERMDAENAQKSVELTAERGQNQARNRSVGRAPVTLSQTT